MSAPGVTTVRPVPEWHDRALCAQTDPEAFFPEKGGSIRAAKRVCQACELRTECLEHAIENDEQHGIWGGLSVNERLRVTAVRPAVSRPRPSQPPAAIVREAMLSAPAAPSPEPARPERCEDCGYLKTSPGHKVTCEEA
jgi:WhiB family redox-sensing transcriptional regulator